MTLFVVCEDGNDLSATVDALEGNLTTTVHAEDDELESIGDLLHQLREKAGRVIWNGFPHTAWRSYMLCSMADPIRPRQRRARHRWA